MANAQKNESVAAARALLKTCNKAALGTVMPDGSPLVTLVAMAASADGAPLLLMSRLAAHTKNIVRDARASLLLEADDPTDDPMTGERLSLTGRLVAVAHGDLDTAKKIFTARHAGTDHYDTELDFNYFRFEIDLGRFNQGFGRFRKLGPAELLVS
jgi:heme oxygenase (biliverdin-IX-beta and delta-forming)